MPAGCLRAVWLQIAFAPVQSGWDRCYRLSSEEESRPRRPQSQKTTSRSRKSQKAAPCPFAFGEVYHFAWALYGGRGAGKLPPARGSPRDSTSRFRAVRNG